MRVWSLASLIGLKIRCCHNCNIGCRCSSDPALLWLWHRPAAPIWPLARELPYAASAAVKRKQTKFWTSNKMPSLRCCFVIETRTRYDLSINSWRAEIPEVRERERALVGGSIHEETHPLSPHLCSPVFCIGRDLCFSCSEGNLPLDPGVLRIVVSVYHGLMQGVGQTSKDEKQANIWRRTKLLPHNITLLISLQMSHLSLETRPLW